MELHEIRLRGGWECRPWVNPSAALVRLSLPTRWNDSPAGRLRLSRRFQRPPQAPDEPAALLVRRSPGILSITLNGNPLRTPPPEIDAFEVALGALEPQNELVLEVAPPPDLADWGLISLVFSSAGAPAAACGDRQSPGENPHVGLE
ncbi:MAG: hypothetical protein ACYC61_24710 [Isosphaeraceae bacterium]